MSTGASSQSFPTVNELARSSSAQPCTLIIFGGSGDLTRRKLLPAVYNLLLDGLLPSNYAVLGLGRKPMSHEKFREVARKGIEEFSRQTMNVEKWNDFQRRLFYINGEIDDHATFAGMKNQLEEIEKTFNLPGHRIYYLAIPPTAFAPSCEGLSHAGRGLNRPPSTSHSELPRAALELARQSGAPEVLLFHDRLHSEQPAGAVFHFRGGREVKRKPEA